MSFATSNGMEYLETSAKEGNNVSQVSNQEYIVDL